MRTLEEAESWARSHGAMLKVNFPEGVASLQIGEFVAYSNGAEPLASALPGLVMDLERQLGDELTQPDSVPAESGTVEVPGDSVPADLAARSR